MSDRYHAAPSAPANAVPFPSSRLSSLDAIAVAGRLHEAMYGDLLGTREQQVFEALRGLSAEEVRQVAHQYEVKYNLESGGSARPQGLRVEDSLLYARLQGELDENAGEWARAQALLGGEGATADAVALRNEAGRAWPFGRGQAMLDLLRQAPPSERQAIVEAFAEDYARQTHLAYSGRGAQVVPATKTPEYSADPSTLLMNVLKPRLSGSEFTEAVGLIAAARSSDDASVVASSQGQAAVGRLYSLLDRPFPDTAGALAVLEHLAPEERRYLQGQATAQAPSKLAELLEHKLSSADFKQATAYLAGDPASAQATALFEALSRKGHGRGGTVAIPDVAAAERILRAVETDAERRALLASLQRQYDVSIDSLVPTSVSAANRDVLLALAHTSPELLSAQAETLASLPAAALEANLEFRADTLRRSTRRLLGVDEAAVRQAFAGLTPEQARALAGMPLDPAKPGRTLEDELSQWYRGGGGGRFSLELQQMLDGDATATGNLAEQIDEAQAQYTLETSGSLVGANDSLQRLLGNDARAVLDADAARLRAAEAALRANSTASGPARADLAVAYLGVGLHDYRTAKEATTEAAKTVATTVAVVGTTIATAGTAAAVFAPVAAGAGASLAATQLNGASNSWQDDAISAVEGAANALTFRGSAVTVRGGQYLVREAVEEGGQQVFRKVSRSLAQEAVERGLAEGAGDVLAGGGRVVLRGAGRELTIQAFQPTLAHAIGQNVAEGVTGSALSDLGASALRGEFNPQQMAANGVLAAATAGLLGLGLAGASRLAGASPAHATDVDRAVSELKSGRPVEIDASMRRVVSARLRQELPDEALVYLSGPDGNAVTIVTEAQLMARAGREGTPIRDIIDDIQRARQGGPASTAPGEVPAPASIAAPLPQPDPELQIGIDRVVQRKLVDPVTRRPEFLALGFHPDRPNELKQVLESTRHLLTADTVSGEMLAGTLYTVKTDIVGPNGRRGALTAFWEVRDGEDVPALVSAVIMRTLPDGQAAQQLSYWGVTPVLTHPVKDATGRIVDGVDPPFVPGRVQAPETSPGVRQMELPRLGWHRRDPGFDPADLEADLSLGHLPLSGASGKASRAFATPVDPEVWASRVPDDIVEAIRAGRRVLVVGDYPGDPDCWGSAVGLARFLREQGMDARAFVNAPPPLPMRPLLGDAEIASPLDVTQSSWDTVIVVDNSGDRIGAAATAALRNANRAVILDHHHAAPTPESLGLREGATLHVWKETWADAASIMVLATAVRLARDGGQQLADGQWRRIVEPLVNGIYSDTRGLVASKSRDSTVGLVRGLIRRGWVDIERALPGFESPIPPDARTLIEKSIQSDVRPGRAGLFVIPAEEAQQAWRTARALNPGVTWNDFFGYVQDSLEDAALERELPVTITIIGIPTPATDAEGLPDAITRFSVRTLDPEQATLLARTLSEKSGGKDGEAGGSSTASALDLWDRARRLPGLDAEPAAGQ